VSEKRGKNRPETERPEGKRESIVGLKAGKPFFFFFFFFKPFLAVCFSCFAAFKSKCFFFVLNETFFFFLRLWRKSEGVRHAAEDTSCHSNFRAVATILYTQTCTGYPKKNSHLLLSLFWFGVRIFVQARFHFFIVKQTNSAFHLFETDDLWTRYLNRCCPSFELVPFFEAIN
jgi:hypothetical protein